MQAQSQGIQTQSDNVVRSAGIVSVAVAISRITGLIREIVLAAMFGAGAVFDAFRIGFTLPNLTRDLFGEGALSAAFVPVFTRYLETKTRDEARILANLVATALIIVVGSICVLGIILSTPDAQREDHPTIVGRDRRRSRNRSARRSSGFSGLSDCPELWRLLATMACPLDPSDGDWSHASAIVCRIIGQRLGDARLQRTVITLRCGECDDGCRRCDADTASEEVTVRQTPLTLPLRLSRLSTANASSSDSRPIWATIAPAEFMQALPLHQRRSIGYPGSWVIPVAAELTIHPLATGIDPAC